MLGGGNNLSFLAGGMVDGLGHRNTIFDRIHNIRSGPRICTGLLLSAEMAHRTYPLYGTMSDETWT